MAAGTAVRCARLNSAAHHCLDRSAPLLMCYGPEFRGRELDRWAYENGVKLFFIDPGKPMQNGSIEGFNGRFREECLDQCWFTSLAEARWIIEAWRVDYNQHRPHTSLRMTTPAAFAAARPFVRQQPAPAWERYEPGFPRCPRLQPTFSADSAIRIRGIAAVGQARMPNATGDARDPPPDQDER